MMRFDLKICLPLQHILIYIKIPRRTIKICDIIHFDAPMRRKILKLSMVGICLLVIAAATIASKEEAKLEAVQVLYDFGTAREGMKPIEL